MTHNDTQNTTSDGSEEEKETTKQDDEDDTAHFEVTVRRGNDDHLDVVTVEAEDEKAAERKVKHENADVRMVVPDTTVEVRITDNGRRYGGEEDEEVSA